MEVTASRHDACCPSDIAAAICRYLAACSRADRLASSSRSFADDPWSDARPHLPGHRRRNAWFRVAAGPSAGVIILDIIARHMDDAAFALQTAPNLETSRALITMARYFSNIFGQNDRIGIAVSSSSVMKIAPIRPDPAAGAPAPARRPCTIRPSEHCANPAFGDDRRYLERSAAGTRKQDGPSATDAGSR